MPAESFAKTAYFMMAGDVNPVKLEIKHKIPHFEPVVNSYPEIRLKQNKSVIFLSR